MTNTVHLRCACGAVEGELKVVEGAYFHVQCLCCDCQRFAAHLNNGPSILDEHGGTELFQTYPAHIQITGGQQNIGCVQLSEKGLYRWHTTCCNMPVANTMRSPKTPFVGISVKLMQFADEQQKLATLGPITMKAFGRYAKGAMPPDAHVKFPLSYMPKIIGFMLKGMLGKKNIPSPFFKDGQPVAAPLLLSAQD